MACEAQASTGHNLMQEMHVIASREQTEAQLSRMQTMLLGLLNVQGKELCMQPVRSAIEHSSQQCTDVPKAFQLMVPCSGMILGIWSMSAVIVMLCIWLMNTPRAV